MDNLYSTHKQHVIDEAKSWLNTPYIHQASRKNVGCDCLGLLLGIWRSLYGFEPEKPPAYTPDWSESTGEERLRDAALRWLLPVALDEIGSSHILLYRMIRSGPAKHLGILVDDGHFIHAHSNLGVIQEPFTKAWRSRLAYGFGFPEKK